MKLATLKTGARDGRLVIVSRDLARCAAPEGIAPTLQHALDNWAALAPQLAAFAAKVEQGGVATHPFNQNDCESPLPRAYQWADGSAYINHVELVRKARGAEVPASFYTDPLMYQGGSDGFLAPTADIPFVDAEWGYDLEAEIAVITGDVPMGVTVADAGKHIQLIMLCNDVSLRGLIPNELAKGFGFFQGKPASAFSPVAVTPDELGPAWRDGRLHLPLTVDLNDAPFGRIEAGDEMTFSFPQLIAHAARTRSLAAGTIVGSGTVSNRGADGGPGAPVSEGGRGYACLAEIRMIETIRAGRPSTPFLKPGDTIRIEMLDGNNASIFGAIRQKLAAA